MKRFLIAAVFAVFLGLGFANTADAQYIQQYTTITPNGGVVFTNNYSTWGAYQSNSTYVSPFGGVKQQAYYNDVFGNRAGQAYGVNRFGYGFNRGYYQPNPYLNPFGGYSYNFYGRRW